MMGFPTELLPSTIFETKKAPILWIGSGIPKRYVKGFMTWEDMLKSAAFRAGINEDQFVARLNLIRNDLGPAVDEEELYSTFALDLSNLLNEMIAAGDLKPGSILNEDQMNQYRHGVDPLKLLICSDLANIEFKEEYSDEIHLFRKLSESTPIVITTNYDQTIETLFDNRYKVYSSTDEYYFSDSVGIGEIYKIHGTIKRPSSLVININDYEKLKTDSYVITSKIVTSLCESPMVIMGYSMGDKIIRDMIGKMFTSFTSSKKELLAKNILYIEYRPGQPPKRGTMQIESESGMYYINTLAIDDFSPVLKDLTECNCTIPVAQIRKIKKMVMDVISDNPSQGQRIAYVGIEGIDEVDPKRTVIAFTTSAAMQDIKASQRYEIPDLLEDVLYNDEPKISAQSIVDVWFETVKYDDDSFIPIFHYLRLLNRKPETYSSKMNRFINHKRGQYESFELKKHSTMIDSVHNHDDFVNLICASGFKGDKFDLILHALMNSWISEDEAVRYIRDILNLRADTKYSTQARRAITYLAFKDIV